MPKGQSISSHIKDLGQRDITVAYECIEWLAPNQRDIDRRQRPKRIANRYIAACMIIEAAKNPAFAREVLDRTEGKVADKLITLDMNDLVRQLEAARQRVLTRGDQHQQLVFEGQASDRLLNSSYQTHGILTPSAVDASAVQVFEDVAEDALPVPVPTNTLGSHQGVSSNEHLPEHTSTGCEGDGKTEIVDTPTIVGASTRGEPEDVLELE